MNSLLWILVHGPKPPSGLKFSCLSCWDRWWLLPPIWFSRHCPQESWLTKVMSSFGDYLYLKDGHFRGWELSTRLNLWQLWRAIQVSAPPVRLAEALLWLHRGSVPPTTRSCLVHSPQFLVLREVPSRSAVPKSPSQTCFTGNLDWRIFPLGPGHNPN